MSSPYRGNPDYRHGSPETCAVLMVNLGTPDAPDRGATRRYLAEFLSDPRVIEVPRPIWLPLLHGIILPLRSGRSAHAYRSVWTPQGSPLRVHSEALAAALQARFDPAAVQVRLAMRYGRPGISEVLRALGRDGLRRLIVLPLYPQYSATTTATVIDAVTRELSAWRWPPELRTITDYFAESAWLDAVAASVRVHWQAHGRGERLLFSFHGIPQRYFRAGDPYFCHCQASAREIAARLGLEASDWQVSFQSRVGREEWLRPYTDQTVSALGRARLSRLDVICPGFAVDCLETLEEIAMQNAEAFRAAGGGELRYIPALNAGDGHVDALHALTLRHGSGWPEFDPGFDPRGAAAQRSESARRRRDFDTH